MEWNRAKQSIHTHTSFFEGMWCESWVHTRVLRVASCELMCGGSVNYTNKLTQKWTNEMYKFHKTVMDSTRMRTYSFILKRRIALHEFNEIAIESFVDAFCPYFWTFGMFFLLSCVSVGVNVLLVSLTKDITVCLSMLCCLFCLYVSVSYAVTYFRWKMYSNKISMSHSRVGYRV